MLAVGVTLVAVAKAMECDGTVIGTLVGVAIDARADVVNAVAVALKIVIPV